MPAGMGPPQLVIQLLMETAQPTPTMAPKPMQKEVNCTDAFLFGLITHASTSFLSCALPYGARDWRSPSNFWRAGFPRAPSSFHPKGTIVEKELKKAT